MSPGSPTYTPRGPLAIEVRDVEKAFRIPKQRVDSLKERAVHPFAAGDYRELRALNGVSFDVHRGEFFGIVGRNGSGKSTLLKLLASIYRADAGEIRMAGRLAPFIELGVGFNTELTARENVVLNGVMMGLTPRESRARLDAVVEFAELEDFVDLKLKNYSSGMLVRLAFSLMMEVDADILLIDEVLAVGDAAFRQKCDDAFRRMKGEGKTIVLVTHEMTTVEDYCHRAMLIAGGDITAIGDPGEVGRQYLRLNFEREEEQAEATVSTDEHRLRVPEAVLEDAGGSRVTSIEQGTPLRLRFAIEVLEDLPAGIDVGFTIANADGVSIFASGSTVLEDGVEAAPLKAGQRVGIQVEVENPLAPGRYFVHCGINQSLTPRVLLYLHDAIEFVVFGDTPQSGIVEPPFEYRTEIGGPDGG